jgi:60 kDa SS-A/Ro ribonucleoprotein
MSAEAQLVVDRLTDADALHRARVHPIAVLAALKTYEQGRGVRGKLAWEPVTAVIDALDKAFYLAFRNVQPTGKRMVLALDVSGSMGWGAVANIPGLTPRVASAAMALVTARVEPHFEVIAFSNKMVRVNISPRMRLDDVLKATDGISFGGTDCALPMMWAMENRVAADAFVIYTDSETWAGRHMHPAQALQQYRQKMGVAAKLVVVGMVSNDFSIADPNDGGMLDVVGFDTATPQLMADFMGE